MTTVCMSGSNRSERRISPCTATRGALSLPSGPVRDHRKSTNMSFPGWNSEFTSRHNPLALRLVRRASLRNLRPVASRPCTMAGYERSIRGLERRSCTCVGDRFIFIRDLNCLRIIGQIPSKKDYSKGVVNYVVKFLGGSALFFQGIMGFKYQHHWHNCANDVKNIIRCWLFATTI